MLNTAFVIGDPISQSRSPLIHGYWLKQHGIAGSYRAIHVKQNDLGAFLNGIVDNGFAGGNVTVPHKQAVFEHVKQHDEIAEIIGAVNTVWIEDGELRATNTDSFGFAHNLDERAPGWDNNHTALVLGAGGASRAIIHALKTRGFTDIRVANRGLSRAKELADRFGKNISAHPLEALNEISGDAGLVVNTTSLGMQGEGEIPLDMQKLQSNVLVTDIVYVPLETPFLKKARLAGLKTADGLGMLLHQARPGFEKWFGVMPEATTELRQLIIDDMDKAK